MMDRYRADQFIEHTHALVSRGGKSLVDSNRTLCNKIIEGPANDKDKEPSESGPAKEPYTNDGR